MADWFTEKSTIGRLPARAAERWPEREALTFGERRWTFAELEAEVDRAARALVAVGVAPGDKVALWLMNRPEWIFLLYGIIRIGAVIVPLNTRFREDDVRYVVGHANATTLIQSDRSGPVDFLAQTRAILPGLGTHAPGDPADPAFPDLRRVITVGSAPNEGVLWWEDCLARADEVPAATAAALATTVDPDGTSMIIYTSGTTGFPKGAMHGHCCVRIHTDRANRLGITHLDVLLCYLPLFHLYGLAELALMFPITGSRLVLAEGFDPDESVRLIERERVTMVHGFDVHYQGLMDSRDRLGADVSSLRLGSIPAGTEATLPVVRRVLHEFCPVVSAYGLTEGWCCAAIGFLGGSDEQRTHGSGFPMPGYEFRIVDPETGSDCATDAVGEILLRSYMVTQGYYRAPEQTAEAIDADGWLHTGDMGSARADGHIRFLGRFKDMLKVGGENVSPLEVEGYLLERHPLQQIAIVGSPDSWLGEVPIAFVIPAPECALDEAELEAAIVASCRGRLASFKIPRRVFVVDTLPMTASGKVQKHHLRDLALERLGVLGDSPPRP